MTTKEEFKTLFEYLHLQKGITVTNISRTTGISLSKLKNVRRGQSSGTVQDLTALKSAYPEIKDGIPAESKPSNSRSYADRLIEAQERIISLQDEVNRLIAENNELRKKLSNNGGRRQCTIG